MVNRKSRPISCPHKLLESERQAIIDCALEHPDLGNLAVPAQILNKSGKLTHQQIDMIRTHTYNTYRVLEPVSSMKTINRWASYHHGRIDGQGYPFHISGEELSLGARIMAVADVFTALSEDRPYREEMDGESTMNIITNMANSGALAYQIVSLQKETTIRFTAGFALHNLMPHENTARKSAPETLQTGF